MNIKKFETVFFATLCIVTATTQVTAAETSNKVLPLCLSSSQSYSQPSPTSSEAKRLTIQAKQTAKFESQRPNIIKSLDRLANRNKNVTNRLVDGLANFVYDVAYQAAASATIAFMATRIYHIYERLSFDSKKELEQNIEFAQSALTNAQSKLDQLTGKNKRLAEQFLNTPTNNALQDEIANNETHIKSWQTTYNSIQENKNKLDVQYLKLVADSIKQ